MDALTFAILPALRKACELHPGNEWYYDTSWGWGRVYRDALLVDGKPQAAIIFEPNSPREKHRFVRIMENNTDEHH